MQSLQISSKIDRPGFMLAADTVYFNEWCKILYLSLQRHAPWAHCHFHVFDATDKDLKWLSKHDCTYTHEVTPTAYATDKDTSVLYWSAARYIRFPEIYADATPCIDLDADSIMVNDLPKDVFLRDLENSWVPTRFKTAKVKSLASAIGFGLDTVRHDFTSRLKEVYDNDRLSWALDQRILDIMLAENKIKPMDMRYTDFRFASGAYIWTGKGDRVNYEIFRRAQEPYRRMI